MSDFEGLYKVREYRESDKPFILSTALKGLYYGNSFFSLMPKDVFMENYSKVLNHLVSKSLIRVACLPEDEDIILGYSMFSKYADTLHYVFVKQKWRTKGIGRSLCPTPATYTHFTDLGLNLVKTKLPDCIFNPFSLE